jgi:hypothetical protein
VDDQVQGAVPEGTASQAASQEPKQVAPATVTLEQVEQLLAKRDEQTRRLVQSEADKRVAALDRQLQEERRQRQLLEGQFSTPTFLGQDVDPEVQTQVQLAEARRRLAYYDNLERQRHQEAAQKAFKQQVHEDTRQKLSAKGLNPDDPRIKYNLDAETPQEYLAQAYLSAMDAQSQDLEARLKKSIADEVAKATSEAEARIRKDSGVDKFDSTPGATSSQQKFSKSQIRDRDFYEKNREAIDKAFKEGRITD